VSDTDIERCKRAPAAGVRGDRPDRASAGYAGPERTESSIAALQRVEKVLAELPGSPARAGEVADRLGVDSVAREARPLGLGPLLAFYLPDRFPLREEERQSARFRAARCRRLSLRALAVLESTGVRAALLKGWGIAARLYPEPWLRPSADVDVLVSPRDFGQAASALSNAGFRQMGEPPRTAFEFSKDVPFLGPGGGMLELHFGYNATFQARFDAEGLLARSRTVRRGEDDLRVLAPADDFVLQCVHAAHHAFAGAKWLYDLKLAALDAEMDWGLVLDAARVARVASAVGMALQEAVRRMRAPVPERVLRALPLGRVRAAAARGICRIGIPDVADVLSSLLLADGLTWGWAREAAVRPLGRLLQRAGAGAHAKRVAGVTSKWTRALRRRGSLVP
jgi:hypothetical protein